MQRLLSSENSLLGDAIFRGTFSLYLDKKFSDTFLKSVVDTMSKGDRERINCFLKEFKCNDDFSFENLNIIIKIYNNHIDGTDNYLEKIEENYLNKLQQVECSYLNICNSLKTNKNYLRDLKQKSEQLLQSRPIFEVVGNLHYLMTIDEIKENLASSLKNVRILDPYEFSNLNFCDQWFECKSSDISRIFGAKYLKRKFSENNILSFDVPEFIIVTENYNLNSNKKNLKVKIHFGKDFPVAHSIFNAKIYSRKIIGYPVANQHQGNHILQHLGYIDLVEMMAILSKIVQVRHSLLILRLIVLT